jgi:hypothetical protein
MFCVGGPGQVNARFDLGFAVGLPVGLLPVDGCRGGGISGHLDGDWLARRIGLAAGAD